MPLPHVPPLRLSLNQVVTELNITANKVRAGLRAHSIAAGKDGRYSLKENFPALQGLPALEIEAKRSRLQSQIDEAAFTRDQRAEQVGRLLPRVEVEDFSADLIATFVSAIRHSSMTEVQKLMAIRQIREL